MDKYQEHLQDSAPDNSRWDGFNHGDFGPGIGEAEDYYEPTEAEIDEMMEAQYEREQALLVHATDLQIEHSEVRDEVIAIAQHDAYEDWKHKLIPRSYYGVTYRWAYEAELERLNDDGDIPF